MINRLLNIFVAAGMLLLSACDDYQYKPTPTPKPTPDPPTPPTEDVEFPIVAWTGIDAVDAARKFPPMKQAGFNIYLGWYDTQAEVMSVLDAAEAAGVKLIVSSDELFSNISGVVKQMKDHKALYGYHLKDEPEVSDIGYLAQMVKQIAKADPNHPSYINLYPNWAWGGVNGYKNNVKSYLSQVPVSFVSFDHYPIREKGGVTTLREEWYKNLEDIRTTSREKGIPFWAFALSLSHNLDGYLYPVPSIAHLRLQQFSNLVYGCQGFQYFTYWGVYHETPTVVYDRVKTVNAELQSLAPVFYGASVKSVFHTGKKIPQGTTALTYLPTGINSFTSGDAGVVFSYLENEGKGYAAIVNKDFTYPQSVSISFGPGVVQMLKDGTTIEPVSGKISIPAGDILVYRLSD